jgi:hypothetical protein
VFDISEARIDRTRDRRADGKTQQAKQTKKIELNLDFRVLTFWLLRCQIAGI